MDDQGGARGHEVPLGAVPSQDSPLTVRERRTAAAIAVSSVVLAGLVGLPLSVSRGRGPALWLGLVYGALLASIAVVVYIDRLYARQCPRCAHRHHDRGAATCLRCGYDLVARPRYACPDSHADYLQPGRCHCGLRLQRVVQTVMFGELLAGLCSGYAAVGPRVSAGLLVLVLSVGILLQLTGA